MNQVEKINRITKIVQEKQMQVSKLLGDLATEVKRISEYKDDIEG